MPPKAHCGPERTLCGRVITHSAARPGRWFRWFSHNRQYRVCQHSFSLRRRTRNGPCTCQVFDDPATGLSFRCQDGSIPERDKKGELALRPVSYTPWPVEVGSPGERLRIDVGPASCTSPRTFVFERTPGTSSRIVKVNLPRPMGLVFEEDKARGLVVVADFVQGSQAEKLSKVARLNQSSKTAPQIGDVLRGCTCTNLVYPTRSLLGVQAPVRTIVMYGADNQKWPKVMAALKAGARSDGDVTLVLERQKS